MSPADLAKAEHSTPARPHNCTPPWPRQLMNVVPAKAGTQQARQSVQALMVNRLDARCAGRHSTSL